MMRKLFTSLKLLSLVVLIPLLVSCSPSTDAAVPQGCADAAAEGATYYLVHLRCSGVIPKKEK